MIGVEIKLQSKDNGFDSYIVSISDRTSFFNVFMYIHISSIAKLRKALCDLEIPAHGRNFEFQLGNFEPNVGGGGLRIKMLPQKSGKVLLQISAQSEWFEFYGELVKKNCSMFLVTEPVLIDNFIVSLESLCKYENDFSALEADDLHSVL